MSHRQLKHKSTELDDSQSVCAVYVAQHPPATLALRAKRGRDRRKHVFPSIYCFSFVSRLTFLSTSADNHDVTSNV